MPLARERCPCRRILLTALPESKACIRLSLLPCCVSFNLVLGSPLHGLHRDTTVSARVAGRQLAGQPVVPMWTVLGL